MCKRNKAPCLWPHSQSRATPRLAPRTPRPASLPLELHCTHAQTHTGNRMVSRSVTLWSKSTIVWSSRDYHVRHGSSDAKCMVVKTVVCISCDIEFRASMMVYIKRNVSFDPPPPPPPSSNNLPSSAHEGGAGQGLAGQTKLDHASCSSMSKKYIFLK